MKIQLLSFTCDDVDVVTVMEIATSLKLKLTFFTWVCVFKNGCHVNLNIFDYIPDHSKVTTVYGVLKINKSLRWLRFECFINIHIINRTSQLAARRHKYFFLVVMMASLTFLLCLFPKIPSAFENKICIPTQSCNILYILKMRTKNTGNTILIIIIIFIFQLNIYACNLFFY